MDFRNIKTEETVMSKTDTCKKNKNKKEKHQKNPDTCNTVLQILCQKTPKL